MELLIGKPSTKECLVKAIEGETYEFTTMYPTFKDQAAQEGHTAVQEFQVLKERILLRKRPEEKCLLGRDPKLFKKKFNLHGAQI